MLSDKPILVIFLVVVVGVPQEQIQMNQHGHFVVKTCGTGQCSVDAVMFFKQEQPKLSRKHIFTRKNTCALYVHICIVLLHEKQRCKWSITSHSARVGGKILSSFYLVGSLWCLEIKAPCKCVQVLMRSKLRRF